MVHLPADEIKGRIIGREGRNIRTFETVTGVNVIIDDTPEAVLLSCFDPVRREVGRLTLQSLIHDGRIHPHRIEEAYERAKEEVEALCQRAAEDAMLAVGITDLHPEIVTLLGRLQVPHVLRPERARAPGRDVPHRRVDGERARASIPRIAARGAFLHDIGKALTHEVQGSHAIIGAEIARRYGESADGRALHRGASRRGPAVDGRGGADPGRRRLLGRVARVRGGSRSSPTSSGWSTSRRSPTRNGESRRCSPCRPGASCG